LILYTEEENNILYIKLWRY